MVRYREYDDLCGASFGLFQGSHTKGARLSLTCAGCHKGISINDYEDECDYCGLTIHDQCILLYGNGYACCEGCITSEL